MKRLLTIAFIVAACGGSEPAAATPRPAEPPAATVPSDALSQMEIAFVGTPRQSVIQDKIDAALALYGLELTEENDRHAGDALVSVRIGAQERGCDACTEMATLDQMLRDGRLPGVEFSEAVAWASTALAVE